MARRLAREALVVRTSEDMFGGLLSSLGTQPMATRIYAYVVPLIDGRRTLDTAALTEREKLMRPYRRSGFPHAHYKDSRRDSG